MDETRSEAMADALSRLSCGVFAISFEGQVTFMNSGAQSLVGRTIKMKDGRLHIARRGEPGWCVVTSSSFHSPKDASSPARPQLLIDDESGGFIAVYVLPLAPELPVPVRDAFATSRALVLAIKHPMGQPDPSIIRDMLDLPNGESRLASLIGNGKTPREAAASLGITEESARTVLKRVFVKTGTTRQAELAALMTRLVLTS